MGATAMLDDVAKPDRQGPNSTLRDPTPRASALSDPTLRTPTLFDLLGEIRVLDGASVTDSAHTTARGGGGVPRDVPDDERARYRWPGGEPTLDDLIVDAWEGLTALATVACPVCGGSMEPERRPQQFDGAGSREPERSVPAPTVSVGRCRHCSASLS